ncbi:MAG TPA: hypothetical protein VGB13_08300 [Candidatus Krumholzibacteria bacterium]
MQRRTQLVLENVQEVQARAADISRFPREIPKLRLDALEYATLRFELLLGAHARCVLFFEADLELVERLAL